MNEFCYFSTPIYRREAPELVGSTLKCTDRYISAQRDLRESLCADVLQTVSLEHDPDISDVLSLFVRTAVDILEEQGYDTSLYNFYPEAWAQSIISPGYHDVHVHPNVCVSALLFLQVPENGSFPVFQDPRSGKNASELRGRSNEINVISHSTSLIHFDNVIPGTMLLFNSWLPHKLSQSRTNIPTKFLHLGLSYEGKKL
jgi:hypothetical protein